MKNKIKINWARLSRWIMGWLLVISISYFSFMSDQDLVIKIFAGIIAFFIGASFLGLFIFGFVLIFYDFKDLN